MELRHFKKRTPKKLKKGMAGKKKNKFHFNDWLTLIAFNLFIAVQGDPNVGNSSTEQIIEGDGNNTITVTMEPGSDQQTITVNGQQAGQHVVTTNSDGTLSISGLQGHIIGSLGNVRIHNYNKRWSELINF